jgi:heme oxygenase
MRTHGGLVERVQESVESWLRLASASVKTAALAHERGRPLVEAELREASATRYMEAARQAELVAEGCLIQAEYHRNMAAIARGQMEERP